MEVDQRLGDWTLPRMCHCLAHLLQIFDDPCRHGQENGPARRISVRRSHRVRSQVCSRWGTLSVTSVALRTVLYRVCLVQFSTRGCLRTPNVRRLCGVLLRMVMLLWHGYPNWVTILGYTLVLVSWIHCATRLCKMNFISDNNFAFAHLGTEIKMRDDPLK